MTLPIIWITAEAINFTGNPSHFRARFSYLCLTAYKLHSKIGLWAMDAGTEKLSQFLEQSSIGQVVLDAVDYAICNGILMRTRSKPTSSVVSTA